MQVANKYEKILLSNQEGGNIQNMQTVCTAPYQENKQSNQKMGRRPE